eukprot:GHVT01063605.1.p1 GENE.GHVT01063605.1~~GHVT01063605.1.p1  ORF type:complete len:249 (+),score=34.08 GHVT01063605.1:761-1507(+)
MSAARTGRTAASAGSGVPRGVVLVPPTVPPLSYVGGSGGQRPALVVGMAGAPSSTSSSSSGGASGGSSPFESTLASSSAGSRALAGATLEEANASTGRSHSSRAGGCVLPNWCPAGARNAVERVATAGDRIRAARDSISSTTNAILSTKQQLAAIKPAPKAFKRTVRNAVGEFCDDLRNLTKPPRANAPARPPITQTPISQTNTPRTKDQAECEGHLLHTAHHHGGNRYEEHTLNLSRNYYQCLYQII